MNENTNNRSDKDEFVEFHYQKSLQYRTVHCDGIYGGGTPRGYIAVTFLSERHPIPKIARRKTIESNEEQFILGPEETVESLDGIVRTLEVTTMLDLRTAKELNEWLGHHIEILESAMVSDDIKNGLVAQKQGRSVT